MSELFEHDVNFFVDLARKELHPFVCPFSCDNGWIIDQYGHGEACSLCQGNSTEGIDLKEWCQLLLSKEAELQHETESLSEKVFKEKDEKKRDQIWSEKEILRKRMVGLLFVSKMIENKLEKEPV